MKALFGDSDRVVYEGWQAGTCTLMDSDQALTPDGSVV